MSKTIKKQIIICFLLVLSGVQPAVSVWAEDCAALHEQAKKERSLLQRLTIYKSAVAICPDDAELIYAYAFSLERMRKYKKALLQYKRVIELDPSNAKAYFNIGDIYRYQEKKNMAIEAYQKGLGFAPENPRAEKRLQELLQDVAEE